MKSDRKMLKALGIRTVSLVMGLALVSCGDDFFPTPPTLNIQSHEDESGDGFVVTGEKFTLNGDTTTDFTWTERFLLDKKEVKPIALTPSKVTFQFPPNQSIGNHTLELININEVTSITFEHRKIILVSAPNENRVHVGSLTSEGQYEDSLLRLQTGLAPEDIAISNDGTVAFISAAGESVLTAYRLTNLSLQHSEETLISAAPHYILDLIYPQSGLDLASDNATLMVNLETPEKEVAVIHIDTNPETFAMSLIDQDPSVKDHQNLLLPGVGPTPTDLAIASSNSFILIPDSGEQQLRKIAMNTLIGGQLSVIDTIPISIINATDVQIFHEDTRAVITGENQTELLSVNLENQETTTLSLESHISATRSRVNPEQTRLFIPTTTAGIQILDISPELISDWTLSAEPIAPELTLSGMHALEWTNRFGLWLADEKCHVILRSNIEDGQPSNEVIQVFSLTGTGANQLQVQP